jgi:hypothetical protein
MLDRFFRVGGSQSLVLSTELISHAISQLIGGDVGSIRLQPSQLVPAILNAQPLGQRAAFRANIDCCGRCYCSGARQLRLRQESLHLTKRLG